MDVFDLFATLSIDTSQYSSGLAEAEEEAGSFGKQMTSTLKKGAGAVASYGKGIMSMANGVKDFALQGAASADRIDKMSQKIGISREAFQELDFAFSQSGASIENLQMGMRTLTKVMEDSPDKLAELGISMQNANGVYKNQEEIFYDVVNALQGMEAGSRKARLAQELLGRTGTELMPLLNGEAGSLEEMRKQAHELGMVLDDDLIDKGVDLTDTVDKFERSVKGFVDKLSGNFMPGVTDTFDGITKMLNGDFLGGVQTAGEGLVDVFDGALKTIDGLFGTHISEWFNQVVDFQQDYGKQVQQTIDYWMNGGDMGKADSMQAEYDHLYQDARDKANELIRGGMSDRSKIAEAVLQSILGDDKQATYYWMQTGGNETLASYLNMLDIEDMQRRAKSNSFDASSYYMSHYAPHLASGGLAYGSTLAMVGDNVNSNINPEVIAPLSDLSGMMKSAFKEALAEQGGNATPIILDGYEVGRWIIGFMSDAGRQTGISFA